MANKNLTINLYGGMFTGEFTSGNHRYKINGEYKKGVTTILSQVLAKPALMTYAMDEALKSLGCIYDDKLKDWFVPLEKLHVTTEDIQKAAKAYILKREKGGDIGTIVHEAVEQYLNQIDRGEAPTVTVSGEAIKPFNAFKQWFQSLNNVHIINVEQVIYSAEYDYAGTYDILLNIDGHTTLCDLKTSNASRTAPEGIYPDNFIQLGAYYLAYTEENNYLRNHDKPYRPPIDELMIISCKKDGSLHTKTTSDLRLSPEDCELMWRNLFTAYATLEKIKPALIGG